MATLQSIFSIVHPKIAVLQSKTTLNMYTKLLAKRLDEMHIKVSSLDPGWTQTDMGGKTAPRLPKDVAGDILNLLTSNVKSGCFWHQGKVRKW